ncbi:RNA polymerase sigma factor [Microbacterium sp. LWH12-1.2]|uniref:RNA polymerase sigma factor n=1 Tax=Microbacterium sp. LWH12-1.2 TaxID=3135259 RepID=UPI003448126D
MSTDSEIIQTSLKQPAAFAELFDRHARAVNAFAAYRIGQHAAEDVLSETFLIAFRRRADFDTSVESATPWLFGIASRLIRKHRATEAKQWRSFAAAITGEEHTSEGGVDDAMTKLDAAREVQSLKTRIAALAPRDRETLLLYAWQGMTYEEIATTLGVPVGTVRSRLNRVRRRLDPGRVKRAEVSEIKQKGESVGHL